ncbi:MAG: ABC transporter ATP-binding protein, partial [Leptospiraceae bacterium]|nr:ABC transporter ATP-binding protein [Leptospiraceae bacterium]
FQVRNGEILGIIGRNGAGKSTLLKILAGVTNFDSGVIKKKGSVKALIELGVGFNPELTAEENVFYNGLLLGYTKKQILSKIDEIFEFTKLEDFRNYPLKTFSSGMQVRLGFALATLERPDILLIDEALSVGDANFQQKSIKRIQDFVNNGTKVIFVSHDLHLISYICSRVLVLEKGKVVIESTPKKAIEEYMQILGSSSDNLDLVNNLVQYVVYTENEKGFRKQHFFIEEMMVIKIQFQLKEWIPELTAGFHIEDRRGVRVFGTNSHILNVKPHYNKNLRFECKFQFPVRFREGGYSLSISIHRGENHTEGCLLWKENVLEFEVERGEISKFEGLVYLPTSCEWK